MAKKKTIDTSGWISSDTPTSNINTSDWKVVNTPLEQDFNIGNVQAKIEAEKEFDANLNTIMDKIPELNKQERDYLMKVGKSGQLTRQEIQSAIDVMRGADTKQQQYVSTSGDFKQLKSPSELAKEQAAKGGMSTLEMVNEGVDNLFAQTGKLLGRGQYYMKDNGRGIKVPVALAIGERPEAGHTVDSIWGSEYDAEDDSRGTDIAKKIVNLIPQTIQGILSLPELAEGLATGETGTSFKTAKNLLESAQFKTADKYNESVVDTSKIKKFSDVFDADVYDMSSDKLLNTAVNAGTSILQLFLTRGALGFTKATGGIAKTGNVMASFTTNLAEPLKAADDAGVKDRDKYLVALAYSSVATGLELGMGIEGKILNSAGKSAQKSFVKNLIKDNIEVVGGKVTKESLDKLYTETVKKLPSFWARNAKNVVSEASEEVLQNMAQNGIQQIHDEIVKDNPDEAKYNSKFWSPESLGDYINSAISGAIGGAGGSFFTKSDKQSKITYDAVSNEKETELKADLASSLNRGKITQDEYDRAIFKIDAYKEYFEATKDKPIDDESKRKIFDLTYEKQNIKSAIETLKQNNRDGINDVFITQKEAELKDLTNQANEIWTKANPSSNPNVDAKQEVPAWRVTLDDFAKETNNDDKAPTQVLKTREQILEATGLDESLNKLAQPFKVEFKTPRVPEDSDPIKIENGKLYEPYETEATETKDSTIETRELPVYAFEDKEGGTWLFAVGEQTDNNIPDTSYLVKLNEDGTYSGHEEFHFETPKMNMFTFDNIKDVFNKLELEPVRTAKEVKGFEAEEEIGPDETLYNEVYADVKAGKNRGKLTALPNNTLGVIVNGKTISFADSSATNSRINRDAMPSGDVEVGIRNVEGIQTPDGEMTGLMVYNVETGEDIGYLRATEKSMGKRKKSTPKYTTEQEIGIPKALTEKGQEVLDKLKADSDKYQLVSDENGRRYINKETGEEYKSVSKDSFKGKEKEKKASFGKRSPGNIIQAITKIFFEGKIKPYSEYSDVMSEKDYNDIIENLDSARKFAVKNGFSIISEDLILADDNLKIAGNPNIIMVDKNGNVYVYDVATIKNPTRFGRTFLEAFEQPQGKFPAKKIAIEERMRTYADILKNKHGIEAKGIGVIPFEVDYEVKGDKTILTKVVQNKRYDFIKISEPKVEVKQGPKQPLTTEEVSQYMQGNEFIPEEGMNEEDFDRGVLEESENPAQIAATYLTTKKDDTKAGENYDVMDSIYTFFKNGGRLSVKAFERMLDPNFRNKLDTPGINSYVATKGGGVNLDSDGMRELGINDPEQVSTFIKMYPRGFTEYERVFEGNKTRNKLAVKFKELTGRTLTEKIANQLAEAMYGVQMKEETKVNEAEEVAKAANEAAKKAFMPESEGGLQGKDIISDEGDVPYQKKAFRSEKADKVVAHLEKVFKGKNIRIERYSGDTTEAGYVQKIKGATDAVIYINDNYAGLDTPIHEAGHIIIEAIGYNNRVIQAAIKQLKDSDLWKETAKAYPELSEKGLAKEVLAEAIGREGAGIFESEKDKSKFKQFLDYIFDKIKQIFGLDRNIAKSLAKRVIAGDIKVDKDLEIKKQYQKESSSFKKKPMLDEESYYRIAYGEKRGITLDNLRDSVDRYKAMADADPNDKTAARKYEDAKNKVEEFDRAYKKYKYDYNKLNKLKEEKGNLDGKSFDELVEIYNIAAEFDPLGDNSFLNDVKYRIAYLMAEEQRKFLESKGHSVKPKAFNDIKDKDVLMKSLSHMTEAFPEMQYLSKAYDAAVREMNMERREKQMKLDALAKSVAKEESKTLGLKMKDFLTGKAYEFFKWMDKNGELISTDDAYKLSKAKGDYVKFYREIREEYKDLQENTPAGYDENALLMTDKNFSEKLSSNGIVSAIQSWLGTNSGMRNVVMNYTHSDKRTEPLTLAEIEVALQNEANKGIISAAVAAIKSGYYNTKAKKLINKGVDEEGNDISHLKNQGDYMLDKKGKLVNKFGTKRPAGYDYSKDFHAAMVQYLTDMTWTKHMQPLIPMVESVEQYSKATGATKGASKNLAEWIKDWKRMHLYKEKPITKFPELDLFMRFLRKMTSLTSLAFNVKASIMNLAVGEYNNWKELGGKDGLFLKGHKRLVSVTPSGKKKFSTKAYNILMKNNVIATDYDETPTMKAGQIFTYLGMGMTKLAEYTIQGSMFLGQIPNDMWKDFDAEGNYKGSDPNYKEKLEQYKTKVSDIHGKYSAKDRRNFELYEFGKFVGQFKTWIPDWWKERFGEEYIDQYGKRHKGVYRDVLNGAILELRKDIMKPEFWTSDKLEYVNARKNLKAAMVFGILLAINAGGDDDKKRRKKADFLTQAIGNLTFIFDPEQAKYMLKTPVAGMSYANSMLNLITDLSFKNAKKVTPYAKLTDAGEMFED